MASYQLQLFINKNSAVSAVAIENLHNICKKYVKGYYELEIIDVMEDPEKAEEAGILAIPTLIRKWPKPEIRMIGALTFQSRVLTGLGIIIDEE